VNTGTTTLHEKLATGRPALGLQCRLGSPAIAERFATAGLDYVYLDQQHGFGSRDVLVAMLQAAARTGTALIVRVPANDAAAIGFALDAGAHGVLVPGVESAADAARAVRACRYAPAGDRSWGTLRGERDKDADIAAVNSRVLCFPLVESAAGVEAVSEITAVDGVSGVWIGPADLALTLGLPPGGGGDPRHAEAIERIRLACAAAGIPAAVSGDGPAKAAAGFGMVTVGSDDAFLAAGLRAARHALTSLPVPA
jgi:4-hydroxy-2-oxoheptanedioate aldolase